MVIIPSTSSLQLSSNPLFTSPTKFHPPLTFSPHKLHAPPKPLLSSTTTRASTEPNNTPSEPPDPPQSKSDPNSDEFDTRLSQLRLRYKSGTGKKAEVRKGKKPTKKSSTGSAGVFLPPVVLKEQISDGVKVDFGFSPYSERINGRIAILGLSALLLVELATGKSVISYHTPSIIFIQLYFVAAVSALFVKVEKERVSVWPQSPTKN